MRPSTEGSESAKPGPHEGLDAGEDVSAAIERLALKLLAAREHSRLELTRKLRVRGYDSAPVKAVLDRLALEGAIDEARLAEHYVAERARKGFGPVRITVELRDKGLPEELFNPYLNALGDMWPEYLAAAHDRRFGPGVPADRAEYARRARFLEQRGFPVELIRRFLRLND